MRLPNTAHTSRPWRIHELAPDFRLEDVWALPTPGGPDDFPRLVRQATTDDPGALDAHGRYVGDGSRGAASRASRALFALRWKLGDVLGWDDADAGAGAGRRMPTLRDRLPADLRDGPSGPDPGAGVPMTSLYLTGDEWAAELANRTVHAVMHIGWVRDETGRWRGQMAVLVKPDGWLGAAYLAAIKPFRLLVVYPALMRSIGREWQRRAAPEGSAGPHRARRVGVTDPVVAGRRHDYADAFALRLDGPDPCSPEEWVRAGVDATPAWVKRVAGHADGLGSARIVASDDDVVVLEDADPLMHTTMVGRNVQPGLRVLTTVLRYRRPRLARAVWAVVGILHRRTARRVVAGGVGRGDGSADAGPERH
jgi:hypothetical protein